MIWVEKKKSRNVEAVDVKEIEKEEKEIQIENLREQALWREMIVEIEVGKEMKK